MQLHLGAKIRELRHRDNRTQEALAEALGVTPQAVSRWEACGSYPDMNLIPSIAGYFGVTIDELFGYSSPREQRIDMLMAQIQKMRYQNSGVDTCLDDCITLAREALAEFPGNPRLMASLASVLYTAGYVRHGEHHVTDAEGYSVYDTARHRQYAEWREAITLYEKALAALENGSLRHDAVDELSQLYLNVGEHDKALALAEAAPDLWGSRDFLRVYAYDGKEQAAACGEALLKTVHACAALMIQCVLTFDRQMTPAEKAQSVHGAIRLFDAICTDGNAGEHHAYIAKMSMLLSVYLWTDHRQDEAFEALNQSLAHCVAFVAFCRKASPAYTAPLIRLAKADVPSEYAPSASELDTLTARLPEDWPWWDVPEKEQVRKEMQSDPRWVAWVAKANAST